MTDRHRWSEGGRLWFALNWKGVPLNDVTLQSGRRVSLPKPFLRWAGGKQKLASALAAFAPDRRLYGRYFEPFLGGGALFFRVRPERAIIADINAELVNCYQRVKDDVKGVTRILRRYASQDSPEFYYSVRKRSTTHMSATGRAARFIYLNKTAFNGIYRVNTRGHFNVPYGPSSSGPAFPSAEVLRAASVCLQAATIRAADFEALLEEAAEGDFVYLDPPYPPRSSTAYFAHYTPDRFCWPEQLRVAKVFRDLARRGCFVMLSNAAQKRVIELYRGFRVSRLKTVRWLGSNGDRFGVYEIVVTNYDPQEAH